MLSRPGDYLPPDAEEIPGFKQRLNERLAPIGSQFSGEGVNEGEWEIGDTLAQWWRPNFETFMYPFLPAHVTRPKECKKLYFVKLPKSSMSLLSSSSLSLVWSWALRFLCILYSTSTAESTVSGIKWGILGLKHSILRTEVLSVPKNMKLLAVPLFELYDNTQRYGPQLSAIPHLLSRYNFEFVDEDGNVVAATPGGDPGPQSIKVMATGQDSERMQTNGESTKQEGGVKAEEGTEGVKKEDSEMIM